MEPGSTASAPGRRRRHRPGTYRFFCALHPVQMQERVVVTPKKKHKKKRR